LEKLPAERTDDDVEELMNFMQNISASLSLTVPVVVVDATDTVCTA